jgi:hypothetical protein
MDVLTWVSVMSTIRCQRTRLAVSWLVIQFAIIGVTPLSLCASGSDPASPVECTCSHGANIVCTMHHAAAKRDTRSCSCRGTSSDSTAVLGSLLGPTAVLATAVNLPVLPLVSDRPRPFESNSTPVFVVPDAPPPRA